MALNGVLIVNGGDYIPFNLYGVGVFMAFSGKGIYRNNAMCGAITNDGPLPPGKYWIVERGGGGLTSRVKAKTQDLYNRYWHGAEFGRDDWFALYRDDLNIDDHTWYGEVQRGLFRLHPGRVSEGCITIVHNSDYALIYDALSNTEPMRVPCMKSLMARGWIEVIDGGYHKSCP
ncbi:hypothetical protein CIG19_02950 [Enterobacterales bacterium CwR94]|nr:hypothetical protein CIG19_02950 [Enterobacterales bacterium CwR94]